MTTLEKQELIYSHADEGDEGRESAAPSLPRRRPKGMNVMKATKVITVMMAMKKASMTASMKQAAMKVSMKKALMKVSMKKADARDLTNSWHVNTEGIKEIWVDATLINKRPPLNTDTIIFKVFPLMS